ncbi:2-C-methyl-D-erythritol 4-phosphate cytidylyltransferase [bioreactor metagenome]|uniref:2-C-methyl-D-erythritol 4-phosphate cytidylyltransferase n=1 Tax=bioreactor metagenome TaxID=1076179 RepID=A0A645CJC3_9ZZZZ|nr:2-C-methyl-D-erythritol 4-phosphate cytidylyltransferase [Rikenellaceae bacterium]
MSKKCFVVIVAGGSGVRMGSDIPKQFLDLEGKPILLWTIEAFLKLSLPVEIILVLPSDCINMWEEMCASRDLNLKCNIVHGGITRFHSVKNALKFVPEGALVAVHDGVRPFVPSEMIDSLFKRAEECGAVIPVIKPIDSMRHLTPEGLSNHVKREEYVLIQTPQVFDSNILLKAYDQPYSQLFTDDASVVESAGHTIFLVEGNHLNIKITRKEDLVLARAILSVF